MGDSNDGFGFFYSLISSKMGLQVSQALSVESRLVLNHLDVGVVLPDTVQIALYLGNQGNRLAFQLICRQNIEFDLGLQIAAGAKNGISRRFISDIELQMFDPMRRPHRVRYFADGNLNRKNFSGLYLCRGFYYG